MRRWIVAITWFGLVAVAAGFWLSRDAGEPATAAGNYQVFVPGLSNGPALLPTPTPTPTPIGGGGGGAALEIFVSIDVVAQEPNTDSDGQVDIPMFAAASAPFPGPLDPPVTVNGTVTIAPHPVDAAGCTWARTYAQTDFTMTVLPSPAGSNAISLLFEAPEWHYTISCPNAGVVTRLPAFGELTMLAYLGYAFPEYAPPGGSPLVVPPVSVAPDCIKREVNLHRTVQLADVRLRVVIYEPPCLLPVE